MEQFDSISCFPIKTLKGFEQSSVDSYLPAHTFVYLYQQAALLPYPYGLLLVLPVDITPPGSGILPARGTLAERVFHVIF